MEEWDHEPWPRQPPASCSKNIWILDSGLYGWFFRQTTHAHTHTQIEIIEMCVYWVLLTIALFWHEWCSSWSPWWWLVQFGGNSALFPLCPRGRCHPRTKKAGRFLLPQLSCGEVTRCLTCKELGLTQFWEPPVRYSSSRTSEWFWNLAPKK